MKTTQLIEKLNDFFNQKSGNKKKQKAKLKDLLHKLRNKKKKLEQKLEHATEDKTIKHISRDLKVIRRQREKALKLLSDLKSGKD